MKESDEALANQPVVSGGEPWWQQEFEVFYRANLKELVWNANTVLHDRSEAEDVVAETLYRMFVRWPDITDPTRYARRAVKYNAWKRGERNRRFPLRVADDGTGERQAHPADDGGLEAAEHEVWLAELLSGLTDSQRQAMLAIARGMSQAELARYLRKSEASIRQATARSRHRLREKDWEHPVQERYIRETSAAKEDNR